MTRAIESLVFKENDMEKALLTNIPEFLEVVTCRPDIQSESSRPLSWLRGIQHRMDLGFFSGHLEEGDA